jgi:large repetitive protein
MRNGRRRGGLFGLLRLAPVMVGGFVAALMIGGAATGALLTSSEGSTDAPPPLTTDATTASTTDATTTDGSAPGDNPAAAAAADDAPDLTITKTATPKAVVGGDIVYVVTVKNVGTAPALNVEVRDTLPAGVKHDTNTFEAPTAGDCRTEESEFECTLS